MISIAYYDLGALFPADNYRHFGGLSLYWPAAYLAVALGYNSTRYQLWCACLRLDRRAISVKYFLHP